MYDYGDEQDKVGAKKESPAYAELSSSLRASGVVASKCEDFAVIEILSSVGVTQSREVVKLGVVAVRGRSRFRCEPLVERALDIIVSRPRQVIVTCRQNNSLN